MRRIQRRLERVELGGCWCFPGVAVGVGVDVGLTVGDNDGVVVGQTQKCTARSGEGDGGTPLSVTPHPVSKQLNATTQALRKNRRLSDEKPRI